MFPEVSTGTRTLVGTCHLGGLPAVLTILSWAGSRVTALRLKAGALALGHIHGVINMAPSRAETTTAGLPTGTPFPPLVPDTQIITDPLVGAYPLLGQLPSTRWRISAPWEAGPGIQADPVSVLDGVERWRYGVIVR